MFISKIFSSVRYSLLTLNFLFLITGIAIFGVGVSAQIAYNDYHPFLAQRFFSLPAFLIATGIFIFIIAAFGFFGAALQNYYLNLLYVGLMVVIFIFEVSACIAGYALYNNAVILLQQGLLETIPEYGTAGNLPLTTLWDEIQRDFQCCGVLSANDWGTYLTTTPASVPTDDVHIPLSCCTVDPGAIATFTCSLTNAYTTGCAEALGAWVSGHALSMAVAGLIICLLQLVAAAGAGWIAKRSKFEELN